MSTQIEMDQLEAVKRDISPVLQRATALIVRDQESRDDAVTFGKDIKAAQRRVDDFFDPTIDLQHKAWKSGLAAKALLADPLKAAEKMTKEKVLAFDREAEQNRLAEQRRLQAIADEKARRDREKQEAEARRQRQIEEEQRRAVEEKRRAAEQASAEERERLNREAAAAERKANAAAAKAEFKEETAAAVVAPVVTVAPAVEKQKGESTRKLWKARVTDVSLVPREYMTVNQQALDGVARATKGAIQLPGVEFYSEDNLALGAR